MVPFTNETAPTVSVPPTVKVPPLTVTGLLASSEPVRFNVPAVIVVPPV